MRGKSESENTMRRRALTVLVSRYHGFGGWRVAHARDLARVHQAAQLRADGWRAASAKSGKVGSSAVGGSGQRHKAESAP